MADVVIDGQAYQLEHQDEWHYVAERAHLKGIIIPNGKALKDRFTPSNQDGTRPRIVVGTDRRARCAEEGAVRPPLPLFTALQET
jgi:hypothetical protein